MSKLVKAILGLGLFILLAGVTARLFLPSYIDKTTNKIWPHDPFIVPIKARTLHKDMLIMDWHADTFLWNRDPLKRHDFGHVDIPRLNDGNIAIQMFTTVTKSPEGQNYEENSADSDRITSLVIAQGWPIRTWTSLLERALYQATRLDTAINTSNGGLQWIRTKAELQEFLINRHRSTSQVKPIGALLGTEGGHPLEGDIKNIDKMYDAGFRMVGLTHFFDNELGGSLHGKNGNGLSNFGKKVIQHLDEKKMIIDLAHASEAMARDVLSITKRPVVISHTGLKGYCNSPRNYPDDLMKEIAGKGGLIALGFWDGAVCNPSPQSIAAMIKYGIKLVGSDHLALGSDWDGATETIAADDLHAITAELLALNVTPEDIRKIMGGNSIKFISQWLPEK